MNVQTLIYVIEATALLGTLTMLFTAVQRGRRAQRELAEEAHERALAFDQRCDALQAQIDRLALDRGIGHVAALASRVRQTSLVSPEAADRLDDAVFALRRATPRR